ncbi:PTS cellobiose transporter subunit IIBC [Pelistega indica]|uniref:PTS cellobiose transporter subunit IIBC n=1 Tax=Pelistega indica TaxID=1414851 RepID=V8G055_9BURK|nr:MULTISPECIES: PTS IIA-like nitrogen regulatory protein PtsN [Pelistega]ETD69899.1 PTS cellobiose transporter subunit IIBC [Pelistega indica]
MTQLSKILSLENILLDVNATSKKRAFEQVALLFENNVGISRATVFDGLFSRERLGSTALGHGVAIPHGRIPKLDNAHAAFVRLSTPIPFDAPDGQNVQVLVCLLVPESATQQHLDLLAAIAQKLSDDEIRQKLLTETDPQLIYNLLTQ